MKNVKSKAARQKLRRWGFLVVIVKDGNRGQFQPPAITIGNSASALAAAAEIRSHVQQLEQYQNAEIKVEPIGYETVSHHILNQIKGLEAEGQILTKALQLATADAMRFELGENTSYPTDFDQQVTGRVGKYVIDARTELRPPAPPAESESLDTPIFDGVSPEDILAVAANPVPEGNETALEA